MEFGYFDKENREYVITRPDTPTPWINYLGGEEYCGLISNTAGGYSFHKDPRDRRILRYRYNNIPPDRPGRYIYLRDDDKGDYWSCTWQPVLKDRKDFQYECRHGLGYTRISSSYQNIKTRVSYFVPLGENLEVWILDVKNNSNTSRNLTLFSYVEFCLWEAVGDMSDFQYMLNIARAECKKGIIYHLTGYTANTEQDKLAYFAVNDKLKGFDCDRERFIGPYRSESNPQVVEKGEPFNSSGSGGNPIGSHCLNVSLSKGQEKSFVFVLGVAESPEGSEPFVQKYRDRHIAISELTRVKEFWQNYLSNVKVQTPDEEVDVLVNTWNQYQCRTTFNWSRYVSFYESGIGRGMGFRDSNQDTLGVVHAISGRVKKRLKELTCNQFAKGDAYHKFYPLSKQGEITGYSDDQLWLVISTCAYIKETGDIDFLKEKIPYVEGESASVYEHLKRALDYTAKTCGPHGLPLIGFADWNDTLNLTGAKKQAESVWVAELLFMAIKEIIRVARLLNNKEDEEKYSHLASEVYKKVNEAAWDGDWYIRAFDDEGKPIGSSKCKEGRIYLNPQSWAVFSGIADKERAIKCMDMARKYLDTKHGIMLMAPPYSKYEPKMGLIGTFPAGLKENGGIFCHSNPWAMIAETILGRGEFAFEYFKKIAPTTKNKIAEIHKTECYIHSQYIAGKDHPQFGSARNSWLTGAAAWNFVAISNYILGVRADYEGLLVEPCIPKDWSGFQFRRYFRDATYEIEVKNPTRVCKGVGAITIDGKKIEEKILPVFKDKRTHKVEVIMSSKEGN